jgi:hypothetical protein
MRLSRFCWLLPVLFMAGCEPFAPWFDYAPDDKLLQHIGRMDWSTADGPSYAHSGVTIRFRCNCTAVDVAFADLSFGGDTGTNWVNVIVDGTTRTKLQLNQGRHVLPAVRGLPKGEHTIELVKRTGPHAGAIQFLGLSLQGILVEPPPWPGKKFEFIGDAMTCGYGNEVRILAPTYNEPNTGYHSKNEDSSQAYGAILGRKYDAMVVNNCVDRIGIYRNSDDKDGSTLGDAFPSRYRRVYPDREEPLWEPSWFTPDLIVINLGKVDFAVAGSAPDEAAFKAAYAAFVTKLREMYGPATKIVCTVGPMMSDFYPEGAGHWTLIKGYVSSMVDELKLDDPHVYYFDHSPLAEPYGEDWHPTAEAHAQMAESLATFLDRIGI